MSLQWYSFLFFVFCLRKGQNKLLPVSSQSSSVPHLRVGLPAPGRHVSCLNGILRMRILRMLALLVCYRTVQYTVHSTEYTSRTYYSGNIATSLHWTAGQTREEYESGKTKRTRNEDGKTKSNRKNNTRPTPPKNSSLPGLL